MAASTAAPASAHGDCSQGYWLEHRSAVVSYYNDDSTKVLASARFGCEGSEQHAKIAVRVRLYRCHRDSVWCDGPLVAVAEDQKTCYHAIACIADTPKVNCASGYKFIAYARWAAYNVDGERVHTNGAWPDMNRELPHPISGIVGTTC